MPKVCHLSDRFSQCLFAAAYNGDLFLITSLLTNNEFYIYNNQPTVYKALRSAAQSGYTSCVALLVKHILYDLLNKTTRLNEHYQFELRELNDLIQSLQEDLNRLNQAQPKVRNQHDFKKYRGSLSSEIRIKESELKTYEKKLEKHKQEICAKNKKTDEDNNNLLAKIEKDFNDLMDLHEKSSGAFSTGSSVKCSITSFIKRNMVTTCHPYF